MLDYALLQTPAAVTIIEQANGGGMIKCRYVLLFMTSSLLIAARSPNAVPQTVFDPSQHMSTANESVFHVHAELISFVVYTAAGP